VIVAVVDSRAARIMTVADFRHSLFVGVPTTFFFNMIVLELTILDTTVDQARTGSSELAWLVLNSRQQALFSALCPCRGAGARRLRFRTWDDFTTSTRDHLAHGRAWRTQRLRDRKVAEESVAFPRYRKWAQGLTSLIRGASRRGHAR